MKYLLDTANLDAIRYYTDIFPIAGVTSNPSIVKKEGKIDFFAHMTSSTLPTSHCWVAAVWTVVFTVPQVRSCWQNVKRSTAAKPGAQKSRRAISYPANMSFMQ